MTKNELKNWTMAEVKSAEMTINGYVIQNCDGRIYVSKDGKNIMNFWGDDDKAITELYKLIAPVQKKAKKTYFEGKVILESGVEFEAFSYDEEVREYGKLTGKYRKQYVIHVTKKGNSIRPQGWGNASIYNNARRWLRSRGLINEQESMEIFGTY